MSSSEDITGSSSSERNNWPFRMLIIGPSGSGKTNTLLHLINNLHPIEKICQRYNRTKVRIFN